MPDLGEITGGGVWSWLIYVGLLGVTGLILNAFMVIRVSVHPVKWKRFERYLPHTPWTWQDAGMMLGTLIAAQALAILLFLGVERSGANYSEMSPYTVFIISFLCFQFIGALAVLILARKRGLTRQTAFGIKRDRLLHDISLGIMGCLAILPAIWYSIAIYEASLYLGGYPAELIISDQSIIHLFRSAMQISPLIVVLLTFFIVILVPIAEEVIFRGLALPVVTKHLGTTWGIITVSLIFALLHQHLPVYLPLFLLSVAFCTVYAYTGSLTIPIAMHCTFNLISIVAILLF